jgi:hypothetical protein
VFDCDPIEDGLQVGRAVPFDDTVRCQGVGRVGARRIDRGFDR